MVGRALVLALLLCVPAVQADWLQEGGDAAHTGVVAGSGPAWNDVALIVEVPGQAMSIVAVVDGTAYVAADSSSGSSYGLWRVDLLTGTSRELAALASTTSVPHGLSDGESLYLLDGDYLRQYTLPDGKPGWTAPVVLLPAATAISFSTCGTPALANGLILTVCSDRPGLYAGTTLVSAIDAATGAVRWTWRDETSPEAVTNVNEGSSAPPAFEVGVGVSIIGNNAFPIVRQGALQSTGWYWDGWVLSLADGRPVAIQSNTGAPFTTTPHYGHHPNSGVGAQPSNIHWPALMTGDAELLAYKMPPAVLAEIDSTLAVFLDNRSTYTTVSQLMVSPSGSEPDQGTNLVFARQMDSIFAAVGTRLTRVNMDLQVDWQADAEPGRRFAGGAPLLAGDRIYLETEPLFGERTLPVGVVSPIRPSLEVHDANDGQLLWRQAFQGESLDFVIDGDLLVTAEGGRVTVFGKTGASISLLPSPSSAYPQPGDEVRIDLASQPGKLGAATQFRAVWGDGKEDEWQSSPVFAHRYETPNDFQARFFARNEAGQSSSVPITFFVGRDPEQTFLQRQFSADNQNTTFFIIGLASTAVVALFGLFAARRKRSIVRRELDAIQSLVEATRDEPLRCEAALEERRAHIAGLHADGKLDEAQVALLEKRIDEHGRQVRLATVGDRFDFLPHGLVKTLQEMLHDGAITSWEREHFLTALAKDQLLTAEQKGKVAGLIDSWFARDAKS